MVAAAAAAVRPGACHAFHPRLMHDGRAALHGKLPGGGTKPPGERRLTTILQALSKRGLNLICAIDLCTSKRGKGSRELCMRPERQRGGWRRQRRRGHMPPQRL